MLIGKQTRGIPIKKKKEKRKANKIDKKIKASLTSPPLSLMPTIFGCRDRCITASTGRLRPVFAGTLYRTMGIGLESATCVLKGIKALITLQFNSS